MSKDIVVLTPNGRRQKIHCTPDTSFIQVLEDVCQKQGFQASDYDLKHHNRILDLTSTMRFSNIPNRAMLEMVEADRKREESNVTVGLQLEDGERRTGDFTPNTCLYDLINLLAPAEFSALQSPTIMYMRQEVVGETALREKTLRQLGLIKGRAILRLLSKQDEARQANVSAVYRVPLSESKSEHTKMEVDETFAETSKITDTKQRKSPDLLTKFKENEKQKHSQEEKGLVPKEEEIVSQPSQQEQIVNQPETMEPKSSSTHSTQTREHLERRLQIEEEVTFLGDQKAIVFMQPDTVEDEIDDLPDDFYDLTIEEVRRLYHDLQQSRISLENTPLLSSTKREAVLQQETQQKRDLYKHVVVRIQFPDHIILQGIFLPTNTIGDVNNFVKSHLQHPDKEFHIFTTPLKETLDPHVTLLEAKFVPCVHMHFKWLEEDKSKQPYLKEDIYKKITKSDAASILASKYRAPNRRKWDDSANKSQSSNAIASTSKTSKLPKWFKN